MKTSILLSVILGSSLCLYACSNEPEVLSVELPPIPENVSVDVNESPEGTDSNTVSNNESDVTNSFKSIRDYFIDKKDLEEEYKNTDVLSSVSGYITQPENFDVPNKLKKEWKSKNHVSVSRLNHEFYLGFDSISFKKVDTHEFYLVLKGVLYNNNNEDVSVAVLGDSKINLNNMKATYNNDYHVKNNLLEFKNPKNIVEPFSSLPVEINYELTLRNFSSDDINVFGDLTLTNLRETLFLQRIKYPEDLNESEKSMFDKNFTVLKEFVR